MKKQSIVSSVVQKKKKSVDATVVRISIMAKNNMTTFQQFLEDKFMENDEIGGMPITKDNYESISESWFENLDVQELIDYGEEYGRLVAYETASDISDEVTKITLKLHDNK